MKKMKRDAVSPFRNKIWDLFEKQSKGMDGADVVMALRQAGEEIWAVGIDDVYTEITLAQRTAGKGNRSRVCFKLQIRNFIPDQMYVADRDVFVVSVKPKALSVVAYRA